MISRTAKVGLAALALSVVTALSFGVADARPAGGKSVGSRGDRTFSAPPATNTAPKAATGMDKTMAQPGKATTASAAQSATNTAAATSRFGSMGGMMKGLLLGGLMGAAFAGIFGAGALASALGFILQTLLIGGLIFLAVSFFRNRMGGNKPAMATAAAGAAPNAQPQNASYRQATGPIGGGNELTIGEGDFNAFERLLGEVQDAYGRNDIKALGDRVTPEMLSYFAGELDDNKKQGVRNEVSSAKLLQGDLAESWREASGDYATVAMRYSLIDATVEAASGRVVSGSKTEPAEVTEIWTFRRSRGGKTEQWELSAIQQTA